MEQDPIIPQIGYSDQLCLTTAWYDYGIHPLDTVPWHQLYAAINRPIFQIPCYFILIPTNIIGTVTLDHCSLTDIIGGGTVLV